MKHVLVAVVLILACSVIGSAQQYTFYFPHIASGSYAGGSWKTTLFFSNSSSVAASGTISFTQSDGTPFNLSWVDDVGRPVGGGNTISLQMGPGETRKFMSVPGGAVNTGFATMTFNAAILGTAMFTQYGAAGQMVGEAAVPLAVALGKQAIFVDTTSDFKTGLAVANPQNAMLEVHYELLNTMGQMVASVVKTLGPYQHESFFVHELFPQAGAMVGRLQFYCTNPMIGIGLRFDPSYSLFTTIPPIAVAALEMPVAIMTRRYSA